MASVVALFIKRERLAPVVPPAEGRMELRAGYGIVGDVNASPLSPRQVLITRLEDVQDFNMRQGELRENVVVAGIDADRLVPGAELRVGAVLIRLTLHCEPCKRIAHLVPSLKSILNRRGVLGVVMSNGMIAVGDDVSVRPNIYPALPPRPYERFRELIDQVPSGRVVTYRQLTIGMGVASSFMRVIPRYASQSPSENVHRIVDCAGGLIEQHIPDQLTRLRAEGIAVTTESDLFGANKRCTVDLLRYGWPDTCLYTQCDLGQ